MKETVSGCFFSDHSILASRQCFFTCVNRQLTSSDRRWSDADHWLFLVPRWLWYRHHLYTSHLSQLSLGQCRGEILVVWGQLHCNLLTTGHRSSPRQQRQLSNSNSKLISYRILFLASEVILFTQLFSIFCCLY